MWGNILWVLMKDASHLPPLSQAFLSYMYHALNASGTFPQGRTDKLMWAWGWMGPLELKALADFSISEVHVREARFLMKRCPVVAGFLGVRVSEGCPCHLGRNCCISRLIIRSQISGFVETRQNWKHKWGWLPTGTTALAFCSYLWRSAMWQASGTRPVLRLFHELDDWA